MNRKKNQNCRGSAVLREAQCCMNSSLVHSMVWTTYFKVSEIWDLRFELRFGPEKKLRFRRSNTI